MNKKKIYLIGKKRKTKEETREAIIDYLNNFYDNKKSVDMVYNESEIFLKLQNVVIKKLMMIQDHLWIRLSIINLVKQI